MARLRTNLNRRNSLSGMKWHYWFITAIYCAGIFYLSSKPHIDTPSLFHFPGADKIVHGLEYGVLAALVAVGIRRSNESVPPAIQLWLPWAASAFYGMTDEFHQSFVPDRSCSIADWLADAAGAGLICWLLCRWVWGVQPAAWDEDPGKAK